MTIESIVLWIILLVVIIIVGWLLLWKLYERSSTEVAFVRTGFMGQKVFINGGALVIPVLHNLTRVSMTTMRLSVQREAQQAVATKERLKIDLCVDFYVKVASDKEGVARAAQTLGSRSMSTERMKELFEGKFVDALRSVAAELTLNEIHEHREKYSRMVYERLKENLQQNGLVIQSVSITDLDQTDKEFFNPSNTLDAEGLTYLTQEIENRRRGRNAIEQDTQIAIQRKNLESEQQLLDIQQEEEEARLAQERVIASKRAQNTAAITKKEAEEERLAQIARIQAEQETEDARIDSEYQLELHRIETNREKERQAIKTSNDLDVAEIEKRRNLEITEQENEMMIAHKFIEKTKAVVEAEKARAEAARAEELVDRAREEERANRIKAVEHINANTVLEKELNRMLRTAETELKVAEYQAKQVQIKGEAETVVEKLRVDLEEVRTRVQAEAHRLLHEADNVLTDHAQLMKVKLAIIDKLESIIRESVRPIENIEGIKIVQVDGLMGKIQRDAGDSSEGTSLPDQVVNSALRYRSQAPLVDAILKEVGLDMKNLEGLINPKEDLKKES